MRLIASCRVLVVLLLVFAFSSAAAAQERRVGLVIGYPTSAGIQWQVTKKFAVRFDGTYSRSSSFFAEPDPIDTSLDAAQPITGGLSFTLTSLESITTTHDYSSHVGSIGASWLITLTQDEHLRTYIAPRLSLGLSRSTSTVTFGAPAGSIVSAVLPKPQTFTSASTVPGVGGLFGVAASIGDRFDVFGEVGVMYQRTNQSASSSDDVRANTVGVRSGVGVMFKF